MRYRIDVKVEGYIHQEDIVWDNWMTYTSCKKIQRA